MSDADRAFPQLPVAASRETPGAAKHEVLRMLRLREVMYRTGLSRSTIYAYMDRGQFPPSVRLGPNVVAWVERDINDWLLEQIRQSRE